MPKKKKKDKHYFGESFPLTNSFTDDDDSSLQLFTPVVINKSTHLFSCEAVVYFVRNGDYSISVRRITLPSPIVGKPRQGNLTGSERQLKDSAANIYNATLKWNSLSQSGAKIIGQIANCKLQAIFKAEEDSDQSKKLQMMPSEMEPLCVELLTLLESMKNIVEKLNSLHTKLQNLFQLEEYNLKDDIHFVIPFQSWNYKDFESASRKIHGAYENEYILKKNLGHNIAHISDRPLMMFSTSAWTYEPYISGECRTLLEALVLETGLK